METRNTKQKEIILDILSRKENMVHPTISEITELVLKEDNSIGQATIYRNIKKLVKEGKLHRLLTSDGYRYDINGNLHSHLVCRKCHSVYDLYDENYSPFVAYLEKEHQIKIKDASIVFNGLCSKCQKK